MRMKEVKKIKVGRIAIKVVFILAIILLFDVIPVSAQYNFKIIVDINQIWRDELPQTDKIQCDGVWSIPGNSSGNKGRDIPITEWQAGFQGMKGGFLCTEDYWRNFPAKNYDLTKDIVSEENIDLVCLYAEPTLANDDHPTTVVSAQVIRDAAILTGKKIIVLSRAYHSDSWKNNVNRALADSNVAGVCFEQKPDVAKYTSYKLTDGIKAVLNAGKKAFLLLPPHFASESNNYTADLVKIFNYLKTSAPNVLSDSSLYFVPNCYNRQKDKTTTMYGGEDSVEGAIKKLKELRQGGSPVSISGTAINDWEIQLSPNPATSCLKVTARTFDNSLLKVMDLTGSIVFLKEMNENPALINISSLEPGMYIAVLEDNKRISQKRFMVGK